MGHKPARFDIVVQVLVLCVRALFIQACVNLALSTQAVICYKFPVKWHMAQPAINI